MQTTNSECKCKQQQQQATANTYAWLPNSLVVMLMHQQCTEQKRFPSSTCKENSSSRSLWDCLCPSKRCCPYGSQHNNIFFDTGMSTTNIEKLLASEPACWHPPEASHDGIVQVAVSQPLPVPS
ncbi:hypothetical protein B0H34DRAFT_826717 [Crassisporium funariophilum]|nr:hypothetical protein B0H34DRAFT_826717 [Crassisporium funariophilum]